MMSHQAPPELTLRAVILAIVLAMILAGANAYLGLFAGMTIASAIPAAVVSMAVLKLLGGGHILENNIVANIQSNHLEVDFSALASIWRNNLLFQKDGNARLRIGGDISVTQANALSYVSGLIEGDPQFTNPAAKALSDATSRPKLVPALRIKGATTKAARNP